MTAHAASHVFFGLNAMWVSTCILAITYAIIMSEKVNRAIIALVGAGVMIIFGVLDQEEAIHGIDFNTIGLLTGMMILVSISRRSGMFQYLAVWSAQAAKAHPAGILFILQITTAVLSAFLDNAPTYLVFFQLAGGDAAELMGKLSGTLAAISMGAVYMGALTYIGNAPNFMVYAIAEERGVKMPSFFGYMLWSFAVLLPVLGLLTFVSIGAP